MITNNPAQTLVLMACSASKVSTETPLPLRELYNGPTWQTLRLRRGAISWDQVKVLSGGLGFCCANTHWPTYEQKISAARVDELIAIGVEACTPNWIVGRRAGKPWQGMTIASQLCCRTYSQVIIAGAGEYRRYFDAMVPAAQAAGLIERNAIVAHVAGGIGEQRQQLGRLLDQANGAAPAWQVAA